MQLCCLRRFLEGGCCSHLAPNMGRRWGPKFNDGKKSLAETNMSNIVTTSVSASPRASLPTELAASASPRASSGSSASPRASLPTEFAVAGTGSLWMKREIAKCRLSYLLNDSRVHTAGTGSLCSAALSSDDGGAASALSSDDGGAGAPTFSNDDGTKTSATTVATPPRLHADEPISSGSSASPRASACVERPQGSIRPAHVY